MRVVRGSCLLLVHQIERLIHQHLSFYGATFDHHNGLSPILLSLRPSGTNEELCSCYLPDPWHWRAGLGMVVSEARRKRAERKPKNPVSFCYWSQHPGIAKMSNSTPKLGRNDRQSLKSSVQDRVAMPAQSTYHQSRTVAFRPSDESVATVHYTALALAYPKKCMFLLIEIGQIFCDQP